MALEQATARKPRSVWVYCTASALFLFATYQFRTWTLQQNRASGTSPPIGSSIPACEIWPGWRTAVPNSISANDSASSSLRLGTAEVVSEVLNQGCTPAKEHLGVFGHSSGEKQHDHPSWSTVRWGQLQSSCADRFYGSGDAEQAMPKRKLARFSNQTEDDSRWPTSEDGSTYRTAVVLRTWDTYQYTDN